MRQSPIYKLEWQVLNDENVMQEDFLMVQMLQQRSPMVWNIPMFPEKKKLHS